MPTRRNDRSDDTATRRRFDLGGELLKAVRRKSDGAMLFEGVPVREGILVYRNADGSERRELVTRQAVEDSARSLARAPVTLEHPDSGFVDPETAQDLIVGDIDGTTAVEVDELGGFARVKLAVRRKDALDAIEGGKVELSPGYEVTLDETPGEDPIHGRYDARQVGRECNHLAIVDRGRGGPTVRLRTDADDRVQVGRVDPSTPAPRRRTDHEDSMKLLPLLLASLGIEQRFDNDEAAVEAAIPVAKRLKADADKRADAEQDAGSKLAAAAAKLDSALAKSTALLRHMDAEGGGDMPEGLEAKVDKLVKDMEAMKGKYDELFKAKSDMEEEATKKADAAELARLQGVAKAINVDHEGLDLQALRRALAKTRVDSLPDDASDERIDGILDIVIAEAGDSTDDRWDWAEDETSTRTDGESTPKGRGKREPFRNSYLDAADKARTGGQQ